jgi:hypothetical protein
MNAYHPTTAGGRITNTSRVHLLSRVHMTKNRGLSCNAGSMPLWRAGVSVDNPYHALTDGKESSIKDVPPGNTNSSSGTRNRAMLEQQGPDS